jgi:hypothetical protein
MCFLPKLISVQIIPVESFFHWRSLYWLTKLPELTVLNKLTLGPRTKIRAEISQHKHQNWTKFRAFQNLMPPLLSFTTESDLQDSPLLKSTVSWFQRWVEIRWIFRSLSSSRRAGHWKRNNSRSGYMKGVWMLTVSSVEDPAWYSIFRIRIGSFVLFRVLIRHRLRSRYPALKLGWGIKGLKSDSEKSFRHRL